MAAAKKTAMTNTGKKPGKKAGRKPERKTRKKKKRSITVPWWAAMLLAVVLMTAVIVPLSRVGAGETGADIPKLAHGEFGIDISHHNGDHIVWDSLRVMTDRNGVTVKKLEDAYSIKRVSFVFIKATEGARMVDRQFSENWENAGKSGIRRGAYHFYRTSKDPLVQAESFIRTVGELRHSDLPPVLDIETIHHGCSRQKLNSDLRVWLKTIETHYGRKPIIYCSDSFAKDYLDGDILDGHPLWIARYSHNSPSRSDWQYWQFTDKAIVYGIKGRADLSVRKEHQH